MSEENTDMKPDHAHPVALVRTRRSLSVIWVVPLVALAIGGWLAFKAWSEKGPRITISFASAEGLEANKTRIRFKDVEVGTVTAITLREDLTGVIVTAEMNKAAEKFMTDRAQFWVVRARVAAGEVTGLGTLFSGAYIGCSLATEGKPADSFAGLETPPVIPTGRPGRDFVLRAETLGSLEIGSPVYYRGIKVGQVTSYEFDAGDGMVNIHTFVNAPYHEKVLQNSRFWNVSGMDVTLDTEGVQIDSQSLVSILLGGVAFDLPEHLEPEPPAEQSRAFKLYASHARSKEKDYAVKQYYLMYFDQSVRGLVRGAPVEIRGLRLGEVIDIRLDVDAQNIPARVAVLVMIEPERIAPAERDGSVSASKDNVAADLDGNLEKLVSRGLRARLRTGNLLTGQLYVDLDFYSNVPAARPDTVNGYRVFPTVPAPLEQIAQRVDNILEQFEKVPFAKIGTELQGTAVALTATLNELKTMSGGISAETVPRLNAALDKLQETLDRLQGTLGGVDATLGADSALNQSARAIGDELSVTIRTLRSLLETLERDPQSLIFGKGGEKP